MHDASLSTSILSYDYAYMFGCIPKNIPVHQVSMSTSTMFSKFMLVDSDKYVSRNNWHGANKNIDEFCKFLLRLFYEMHHKSKTMVTRSFTNFEDLEYW